MGMVVNGVLRTQWEILFEHHKKKKPPSTNRPDSE